MAARLLSCLLLLGLLAGCAGKKKPADANVAATGPVASASPSPAVTPPPAAAPSPTPAPAQPPKPKSNFLSATKYINPTYWLKKLKKPGTPQAQPVRLIGTIKMVNKEDKFVLIDAIGYGATQPGDSLVCIVNQRQSGFLRASAVRNPPFLIADIASGDPAPGDKVYKQ